jgi:hypothetical protein
VPKLPDPGSASHSGSRAATPLVTRVAALLFGAALHGGAPAQGPSAADDVFAPRPGERVTSEASRLRIERADGSLRCLGALRGGAREGLWFAWGATGRLAERREYTGGKLSAWTRYDVGGRPHTSWSLRSGVSHHSRADLLPLSLEGLRGTRHGGRTVAAHLESLLAAEATPAARAAAVAALVAAGQLAVRPGLAAFEAGGVESRRRLLPVLARLPVAAYLHRLESWTADPATGDAVRRVISEVRDRERARRRPSPGAAAATAPDGQSLRSGDIAPEVEERRLLSRLAAAAPHEFGAAVAALAGLGPHRARRHLQQVLRRLAGAGVAEHGAVAQFCGGLLAVDPTARAALLGMTGHECGQVAEQAVAVLSAHLADDDVRRVVAERAVDAAAPAAARRAAARAMFSYPLADDARLELLRAVIAMPDLFELARDETMRGAVPRVQLVDAWRAAAERAAGPGRGSIEFALRGWHEQAWMGWIGATEPCFGSAGPAAPTMTPWGGPGASSLAVLCACMPRTPALRAAYPALARGFAGRSDAEIAADLAARPERGFWGSDVPAMPWSVAIAPGRRGRDWLVREFLHVVHSPPRVRWGGGCGWFPLPSAGRFTAIAREGGALFPALRRQLGHPDLALRATVVEALAWTARRRPPLDEVPGAAGVAPALVVPHILPFLDADAVELRDAALRALAVLGDGYAGAVPRLVGMLADREARTLACRALGRLGPAAAAAVPGLVASLEAPDGHVQPVRAALAAIGWPPGITAARPPVVVDLAGLVRDLDPLHVGALDAAAVVARLRLIGQLGAAARRVAPLFASHFDRWSVPTLWARVAPEGLAAYLARRDLADPLWARLERAEPEALLRIFDRLPARVRDSLAPTFEPSVADLPTAVCAAIVAARGHGSCLAAADRLLRQDPDHPVLLALLEDLVDPLNERSPWPPALRPWALWADRTPQRQAAARRDALLRGWLGHADPRWRRVALELLVHPDMRRGVRAALELSAEVVACHRDPDAGIRAAAWALRRVVAATVPGPIELAARLQAGTWVELDAVPTATLRQVVPDLLRRLRDLPPGEGREFVSALGRALHRTDVTLAEHVSELAAIIRGRCGLTSKCLAISLLRGLGDAARAALPALRAIPIDDPLLRVAVPAIEAITGEEWVEPVGRAVATRRGGGSSPGQEQSR